MAIGIGLDVGGTKILGCAMDADGSLIAEVRVASPHTAELLYQALADCVDALLAKLGPRALEVRGVGVGVPGLVDEHGVLHETANLHGMAELDLPAALQGPIGELLGGPGASFHLIVDNDATCAAAAEHAWGAGRGGADSVLVTLGTGIGGGIVSDGRIVRGARNFGGEVGHMVIDPSGPVCGCGRRGCWERFSSGTGLAYLARRAARAGTAPRLIDLAGGDVEAIVGEHVVKAASEGDPGVAAVLEEFGSYLSLGLANLVEILDPGCIILGGGLVAASQVLLEPGLRIYATTYRRGSGPRAVPVVLATLGERAGAFGAAALSLGTVN